MIELEYHVKKLLLEAVTGSHSGVKCPVTVLDLLPKRSFVGACLDLLLNTKDILAVYWQQRGDGYTPITGQQRSHI